MSATTSQPAAEMSIPAEPGPSEVGGGSRPPGPRAAPARKRFRNRPGRTTGAQARSAAPEKEYDMYDNDACGSGHRGRRRAQLRRAGLAAAVLALMGLLATACGGGSSHARAGGGGGVQAALAYARCMRAHGVPDFPDPDSNGQFNVDPHSTSSQETAADQACHHLLNGGRPAPAAQQQHMLSQLVKYARCMRAHGVPNFPDPQTTGGGIGEHAGVGLDMHGINVNSPQFQSANHACHSLLANAKG
jgi:hypothetical protein